MWKYTVEVGGMMCGMCEAHVNDAVRKACPVKKVSSSRSKNQTVILSETELDTATLMNAIRSTGYQMRWSLDMASTAFYVICAFKSGATCCVSSPPSVPAP